MIRPVAPEQARDKARAHYERHSRTWAAELFMEEISPGKSRKEPTFSLPLHPPTESAVLKQPAETRAWARAWREAPLQTQVIWAERNWPSVGRQAVPLKLHLDGAEEIAAFAGKGRAWHLLRERTLALAERWRTSWHAACAETCLADIPSRLARAARSYEALSAADWQMLLLALDWLLANPTERRYARELPIRGIDTKWIERHKKAVSLLQATFSGRNELGIVMKAPSQLRVRFLDDALAPCGMRDLSVAPTELDRYTGRPRAAIICENLVSTMTLPPLAGVVALHGGGFGVSELGALGWLASTPVLYWGDLDSHGFAILNQWRHHHEHTTSLLMDEETLLRHRDLCVVEPAPNLARLDRLTQEEQRALSRLREGDQTLRLEQERIEWRYAVERIEEALGALGAR